MRWQLPEQNSDGSILERLLRKRGISDQQAVAFLTPDKTTIHDPHLIYGIDAAADMILATIAAGKKIFIHGDYDVDGVCATSLMWLFLSKQLHADVLPRIPNRFEEGYGLSTSTLDDIVSQGGELVITVDCGVKDGELISEYMQKSDLKFVITDHHTITGALPDNVPVVHPRHPLGEYPFPEICGAAVAWKLCQVLAAKSGLDPDLTEYLDLVALATACDVMPLIDENRAIVRLGMAEMQQPRRPGIAALMEVAAIKPGELKTYHLSFVIGPKLNAAGRLQDAMLAVRLLSTDNIAKAREWAQELNNLNTERQNITISLLAQAEEQIAKLPAGQKLYLISGDEWPEGVVGLVAGKLTEKYSRPVLVASRSAEGIVKGSARSIKQFHIAEALKQSEHLLIRHGGHAMAAGFTLNTDKFDEFNSHLLQLADAQISEADLVPMLNIDLVLGLNEVRPNAINELKAMEPFGFGNPSPVVAIIGADISRAPRIFGSNKQHIALLLQDGSGNQVEVIDWGGSQRWQHLKLHDQIAVAGTLGVNEWNGNQTAQIVAKDILLPPDYPVT